MKRLVFLTAVALSFVFIAHSTYAGWGTGVLDRAGDPYNWSAWGFTGVAGWTFVENPVLTTNGFHVSSIYMYGVQPYPPDNKQDMAEVGWLKHPANGIGNPTVFAAWRWAFTYPNGSNYSYQIWSNYRPSIGSSSWFMIQKEGDGAWHGYYGGNQILWMGNRNNLAAPIACSERNVQGTTRDGTYYYGDDDGGGGSIEFHWTGLNRRDSHNQWGNYVVLGDAQYQNFNFNMSCDYEFDTRIYDVTHFSSVKTRRNTTPNPIYSWYPFGQ